MAMALMATVLAGSRSSFHQRSDLYRATQSASFGPIGQLFISPPIEWNKMAIALTASSCQIVLIFSPEIGLYRATQSASFGPIGQLFIFPPIKWNKMEMALTATVLAGSRSSVHQRSGLYRATQSASFGSIGQLFIVPPI